MTYSDVTSGGQYFCADDIDWETAQDYLSLLDPCATGFLFFCIDDDKERHARGAEILKNTPEGTKPDWRAAGPYHQQKFIRLDTPGRDGVGTAWQDFIARKQRKGAGAFVAVNETDDSGKRKRENMRRARAVWAEDDTVRQDGAPRTDWPLQPSFTVQSSPGKYHYYWLLADDLMGLDEASSMSLEEAGRINSGIVAKYGVDGAARDLERVLRLPGTWNLKPGREPFQVQLIVPDGGVNDYPAEVIREAFPPLPVPSRPAQATVAHDLDDAASLMMLEMLNHLPPEQFDSHDAWIKIGHAIADYTGGSDKGLALWQAWSSREGAQGDVDECAKRWPSLGKRGEGEDRVTVATLYYHAEQNGWNEDVSRSKVIRALAVAQETAKKKPAGLASVTGDEGAESTGSEGARAALAVADPSDSLEAALTAAETAGAVDAPHLAKLIAAACPDPWGRGVATKRVCKLLEKDDAKAFDKQVKHEADELERQIVAHKRSHAKAARESGDAPDFPDMRMLAGGIEEPRTDSLPNATAWVAHRVSGLWYNEFSEETMQGDKALTDDVVLEFRKQMHVDKFFASATMAHEGVGLVARENRRHPVREYFDRVRGEWDGVPRIDNWLRDYCHAPDNEHWRAAARLFMIAVVMRTRHPGCKWDYILCLLGPEGKGKSKLCRALAIHQDWYLEGYQLAWDQKTILERTAGKLVAEYAEMAGHTQKEQASIKDAASRSSDRARKAYGRFAETRKRSFVTIANANEYEVLVSKWGNRRFWPLEIAAPIDVEGLEKNIDQLYGEAVAAQEAYLETKGTTDVVLDEAHWAYFAEHQERHRLKTPIEDRVARLFDGFEGGHVAVTTLFDVLDMSARSRYHANDVEHAMQLCGWKKVRARMDGDSHPQRYYVKGDFPEERKIVYAENPTNGATQMYYEPKRVYNDDVNIVHLDAQKRKISEGATENCGENR